MKLSWWGYIKALFKGKKVISDAISAGESAKEAMSKSSWKSSEFWFAGLSGFAAIAAQAGGMVPPPWGAIVLSASTAAYAISRGLAKHTDPLGGVKPGFATTEVWANLLAASNAVLMASAGVVTPETAAILGTIAGIATNISRGLAKGGAQPS